MLSLEFYKNKKVIKSLTNEEIIKGLAKQKIDIDIQSENFMF